MAAAGERAQRTVLVVEDERDLRESFGEVLELEGYQVFLAENGRRALELLGELRRPAIVMLDLMMPVMNGFEFLAELRRGEHRGLPVVVVSAFADRAAGLDVEAVLEKPFRLTELVRVLERVDREVSG